MDLKADWSVVLVPIQFLCQDRPEVDWVLVGLTPEEVHHYIDEYRRLGLLTEWIDEDGFYNLTANEDIPLDQALMIINCCID